MSAPLNWSLVKARQNEIAAHTAYAEHRYEARLARREADRSRRAARRSRPVARLTSLVVRHA